MDEDYMNGARHRNNLLHASCDCKSVKDTI